VLYEDSQSRQVVTLQHHGFNKTLIFPFKIADIMNASIDRFKYILSGLISVDKFPFKDAKLLIISAPKSVFKDSTICFVLRFRSGTLIFLDFGIAEF